MLTHINAAAVATARRQPVLCDNPACCEWGTCPHSKRHAKVTEGPGWGYPMEGVVCGTCCHDTNATCQRVAVK